MTPSDTPDPNSLASEPADWGFRGLLGVLLLCAGCLLATPFVPPVSRCLMNRFQLRTALYWTWAIQQPIPAMYSARNTSEVHNLSLDAGESGLIDPLLLDPLFLDPLLFDPLLKTKSLTHGLALGVIEARTINHFPTREITFANSRSRFLSDPQTKWFVLETSYRAQKLRSIFELRYDQSGDWTMTRIEEP